MATGTIPNLANSAHVATPQTHADCLPLLVTWRSGATITIGDLSGCGEGNLLAPFAARPGVLLFGIEISKDRAEAARLRLPGAQITRAPFEAVRVTPGTISLAVTNPPYLRLDDNHRAEYVAQSLVTRALANGGVNISVIPARSGLDGAMINHWAKHYEQVRCWRFADGDPDDDTAFQKYTQIVLCGVKRAVALNEPDPTVKALLQSWRYDTKKGMWAGRNEPPILPSAPIADPYEVPATILAPTITVMHADDRVLLDALQESGIQHSAPWRDAVTLRADGVLARPIMPPTGPAHLASLILSGLLDGNVVQTPQGPVVLTTSTTKQRTSMPIDAEQREKGTVRIAQIEDNPVLGVLNLQTGLVEQHVGADAFAYLQPLLPTLAAQVLHRHKPLYQLDPEDWELKIVANIGLDKQLPGADYPGLASAQMHRVFAMRKALWEQNRAMINGEPGVGKTRLLTGLFATQTHYWRERAREFHSQRQPAWARLLRRAWKANRHLPGDAPKALPVLISAPKRVLPTWRDEIASAYPEAEVRTIRDHRDLHRWLVRCTESDAPVVVGLISHSTKSATGLRWVPAVLERTQMRLHPEHVPSPDVAATLEPIWERGRLVGFRHPETGKETRFITFEPRFRCPDCNTQVEDAPRGRTSTGDDDKIPVSSLTYFEKKRRWCAHCRAPLWTIAKTEARERRYPHTSFAAWSKAAEQSLESPTGAPLRIQPDGTPGPACPDSFSPYDYAYRKYKGCIALAIIDESHNGRGAATDIAHAHHQMMLTSQCRVLASGTHTGGELRHLFHYLFRYNPQFWLRLGYGWGDVEKAVERYGVVQEHTIEHESDARRGSGRVDETITVIEVPGMSAALLPHLLSELIFIGVLDVGASMPRLSEVPVLVPMDNPSLDARIADAQAELREAKEALTQLVDTTLVDDPEAEARIAEHAARVEAAKAHLTAVEAWVDRRDLDKHYHTIIDDLDSKAQDGNQTARMVKGSLPRWWLVLPMQNPAFEVWQSFRDDWGNVTAQHRLLQAPVLTADHEYPLERKVRELVTEERLRERRVLLYVEQNDVRSTSRRYAEILREFVPWCLPRLDPEEREQAIRSAVHGGATVVIAPYTHVSEGLNLQHEFESIIWIEMAQSHFLREQASRRIWRLGKKFDPSVLEEDREVRIYYLAYQGSVAHRKLHKLGLQSGAAQLFNGDTPDGELVKQAGAQHSALAQISRGVAQAGDEDEDEIELANEAELAAAFAQRNAERHARLAEGRSWIGVQDTLPARLAQLRASQAAPAVEQAAVVVEPAEPVATLVAVAVEAVAVPTPEPVAAPVTVAEVEPVEERAVGAADEPVSAAEPVTPAEPAATSTQPPQWGRPAAPRKPRKPTVVAPNQLSLF